jgi:ketosteroid isomerase-like protein
MNEMEKVWSHSSFVSAIQPDSKEIIVGWEGVKKSWEDVFKSYTHVAITSIEQKVHVEGNSAWVLNHEDFQGDMKDKTQKLTALATNIFVKQSGK